MRLALALPCLAILATANPAAAEVTSVSEIGFVVRHQVEAPASQAEAWQMLIAPGKWWSPQHSYSGDAANMYIDAQATGCFCEKLPRPKGAPDSQRIGSVEHLHVVYADPPQGVLRMNGGLGPLQSEPVNGTLTIVVQPRPDGSRITWEYVVGGYSRMKFEDIAPLVDKVLGEQVERLAKALTPPAADKVEQAPASPG